MNVQKYLTDLQSEPLPLRLPACLLCPHVSHTVQGQLADFHSSLHSFKHCICLCFSDAEVHFVNMTALTRGGLRSSFWIVDRKHIYIGSADMDWRSLSKVTTTWMCRVELGHGINEPLQSGVVHSNLDSKWPQGYSICLKKKAAFKHI